MLDRVLDFVASLYDPASGGYASVPGDAPTLYGTCYGLLTHYYLTGVLSPSSQTLYFLRNAQDAETGYFVGPELNGWSPPPRAKHDREHLYLHSTCTALPVCQQLGLQPPHPLSAAHRFCDQDYLRTWLDGRDMTDAWLEGNNLLFIGQLLVYLRDVEHYPGAAEALETWFHWLDTSVDPTTGLWGTDGYCSPFVALCGGYHQLLVYYHERHPIPFPHRLIDIVLALQHPDGGFSPQGGGGACEDVDAIDVLVNLYKRIDYRQADIRNALRRTLAHLRKLQNPDGGFPYKRNAAQSHMGIPATMAPPNTSTMFATWFRVHAFALIAEVLTDDPHLQETPFYFSSNLSMGWHRPWNRQTHQLLFWNVLQEWPRSIIQNSRYALYWTKQTVKKLLRHSLTFPTK